MSGHGFSGDINLEQTFASEGSGAVRVDFDCTLILHVEAMKLKVGDPANRKHYRNVSVWLQKGLVEPNIVETLL